MKLEKSLVVQKRLIYCDFYNGKKKCVCFYIWQGIKFKKSFENLLIFFGPKIINATKKITNNSNVPIPKIFNLSPSLN